MSHAATATAWAITGLSPTQKAVLLCLADCANQENRCWPSLVWIASRTCLSPRAAWQAVRDLAKRGLVRVEGRGRNQSNVYTLQLEHAPDATAPTASSASSAKARRANVAPDAVAPDASNAPAARGLRTSFQRASHVVPAEVAPDANEPVIEPVKEPVKRTMFAEESPTPPPPHSQPALIPGEPAKPRKAREAKPRTAIAPSNQTASGAVWDAYAQAFKDRHKTEPTRNARVNGQIAQFVSRVPAEAAPAIAAFYVRHPNAYYAGNMHPVWALLKDAEKLHAEWRRGQVVTMTEARRNEQTSSNAAFRELERRRLARAAAAAPQEIPLRVEDDDENR